MMHSQVHSFDSSGHSPRRGLAPGDEAEGADGLVVARPSGKADGAKEHGDQT